MATTTRDDIEAMIARTAHEDRDAFLALYDATSAKLFGVCLRVLDSRPDAEEVLQEVFVKVWRNAGRYSANGLSPMTWLITIARNTAIDRLRARKVVHEDADAAGGLEDKAPGPEAQAQGRPGRGPGLGPARRLRAGPGKRPGYIWIFFDLDWIYIGPQTPQESNFAPARPGVILPYV